MFFRKLRDSSKILVIIVVIAFALGGTLYGITAIFGPDDPHVPQDWSTDIIEGYGPDDPLLTVDGEVVKLREFHNIMMEYSAYLHHLAPQDLMEFQNEVIEFLVERVVMLQEANRRGIEVEISDEEVQEIIDSYLQDMDMTMEEFERNVRAAGDSMAEVRERVRHALWERQLVFALEDDVKAEVEVSEEEILHVFEQAHVRDIFVKFSEHGEDGARERIEEAQEKLEEDVEFSQVAKEYSDSPLGEKGGDMGNINRDSNVHPLIIEYAFEIPEGSFSEIFVTGEGYHIIKVVDRVEGDDPFYEEARHELEWEIWQEKSEVHYQAWLDTLTEDVEMEFHIPSLGGYFWYSRGEYEKARSLLEEASEEDPDNHLLLPLLADTRHQLGETDRAMELYEKALEKFPGEWEVHFMYAYFLRRVGMSEEAGEQLEKVVDLRSHDYSIMLQTLRFLQGMGLDEQAEEVKEIVHELEVEMGYRQRDDDSEIIPEDFELEDVE